MIELSAEQQQALTTPQGRPLKLLNPATNQTFVLLPTDEYDRLRHSDYDDSPWTDEEMDLLAAEDADGLGWKGMEVYQDGKP